MRQQHKHYYCIRAFGDGWKIETDFGDGVWVPIDNPRFSKSCKYRVAPDENGWLPWYGGKCPVDPDTLIEAQYKVYNRLDNTVVPAKYFNWGAESKYPIIAYRVIEEAVADPYAELKAAAKDPTKQIRLRGAKVWVEGDIFVFDEPPESYEIRDKPKKMKLLAYIDEVSGELLWRLEGHNVSSYWKRVPSEDKEVEVAS
jgi:hypothetical protein